MQNTDKDHKPPMEIPREALTAEALNSIIESFILREGTDYGREEVAFATKVAQIGRQLDKGDIKIVFDPNTETVGIVTASEWAKLNSPTTCEKKVPL